MFDNLKCLLRNSHADSQEEVASCPKIKNEDDDDEVNLSEYIKVFQEDIPDETIELITKMRKARVNEDDMFSRKCQ